MATIKTAIQVYDGMSPGLKAMNNAMCVVINSFESLQNVSSNAVDSNSIKTARDELAKAQYAFDNVEREIKEADAAQRELNNNMIEGQYAADGLARNVRRMVAAFLSIAAIRKGISSIGEWLSLSDVQTRAETQLATVMGQRMGTIDIQAVLDATSLQQSVGVVGDEIQLMGAQQMATFLNTEDALHSLIPAMNNLAVQQNGVAVSGENMVNIGNMMGKVMQGQVGALSRVGITFSEAEKQVLKYGTELERADMLAQIITNNVGNMNEAIANTPQGQIQQMKNTWGDIKETVGNHLYPAVLRFFQTLNSNLPQAESMMLGLAGVLIIVIDLMGNALNVASAVSGFFIDNWGMIAPIIWGIIAALVVYNSTMGIAWLTTLKDLAVKGAHAVASWAETAAIIALTAAQQGLNVALAMCPLSWIIILIIALIAVFYAVIAAVNKFAGTSLSATGIIMGAFTTLGAFLWDLFLGVFELVLGVINALVNPFIKLANFIGNVFTNPISSVIYLFQGMANEVLAVLEKIAKAMDFVFDSNMAGTISGWRSGLKDMADAAVAKYAPDENYQKIMNELDLSVDDFGLKRWAYSDAWETGYKAGENLKSKMSLNSILGDASSTLDAYEFGNHLDGIHNGVDDTALNTASMKDSMQATEEELKYLRDIAEKEVVNRFTTAEIKIEQTNNNNINSELDLDGIMEKWNNEFMEILETSAEGVHG